MTLRDKQTDILVIGAGLAGLAAAAELHQPGGERALVIDKGRGVGGRLASRRIGQATFDHGAQFMTARDPRFIATISHWLELGVVREWYRSEGPEGHARWCGQPTMSAVAKHLARHLEVRLETQVVALRRLETAWLAELEDGQTVLAHKVLLTPPVPQSLALLDAGKVTLVPKIRAHLERLDYERCLAVLAVLAGPSRLPQPGYLAPEEGPIAWLADNQLKGVSAIPAVTIHATAAFSLAHWERDRQASAQLLLEAAAPWLGAEVTAFQVHGWRYSKPAQTEARGYLVLNRSPLLVLAGDAFAGARVEGAMLSGWGAADILRGAG